MRLTALQCEGFRALEPLDWRPGPGVNVLCGGNAQGKTTVLEAVLFSTTSKSHRTSADLELVRHGAEGFRIAAAFDRRGRTTRIEAAWHRGAKRFKINGVAQPRISDILGRVNVVFFAPEDVGLIRGSASQRRTFLDMALSQLSGAYLHALQQYRKALRQRNEMLRARTFNGELLDAWDAQLVKFGAAIMEERAGFTEDLAEHAAAAYSAIAGEERLAVRYDPNVKQRGELAAVLASARETDRRRGMTTRGPHRDDLAFSVAAQPARNYGSQGQQRTAALAVKLAEAALIHGRTGERPILMLDDVLSELDARRSERLFSALAPDVQCLLTTTDLATPRNVFGESAAYARMDGGRLVPGA